MRSYRCVFSRPTGGKIHENSSLWPLPEKAGACSKQGFLCAATPDGQDCTRKYPCGLDTPKSREGGAVLTAWDKRCWAEVDVSALRHNFTRIRQKAAGAAIMAVVKADAYGHGDAVIAPLLEQEGADAFAVACVGEALRLRRAGITKPILILSHVDAQNAALLAQKDITQTVVSYEAAQALSEAAVRAGVTVPVHIKVDTGMGRVGFSVVDGAGEAAAQIERVLALPNLCAEGIFTHFAAADSAEEADIDYTRRQYALLKETIDLLAACGHTFAVCHCCNSAGTFAWPAYHMDMVRPGIILYGEQPSDTVTLDGLRPVMRLCAAVAQVKTLHAGDAVGYGCTFHAARDMRTATLSVGYADGYPRALSNRGTVSLHGRPARVLGRVCMDQIMADVTDIPDVRTGDTAIVFGGGAADSASDIAHMTGTISYEILCGVSRRVPRVYMEQGEVIRVLDYLRGE